ncbi:MAG: hypothetical protein QM754_19570 [Tepidisphaeraceae bacterium]
MVGQIESDAEEGVDWVEIDWKQSLRRALRLTSVGGSRVDVLLPPGGRLRQGDVLFAGPPKIAVRIEIVDCLRIQVSDSATLGRLAFDLGNRHLPAQFFGNEMVVIDDGPTRQLAASFGLPFAAERLRFYPEPVLLDAFGRSG